MNLPDGVYTFMAWQAGAEVGPYRIMEQIGSGGMATVYRAYQSRLDRYVAIKVMHSNFSQDKNFLARFEREARIVARLDHPNIVPVYDFDEHEGQPFLVMKSIEGQTLKDVLRRRRLSPQETLQIMPAVAGALTYAHQQGVLHRDIKPSNILIDGRGVPYITDFGLARLAQAGESTMSVDTMLGTPHYISPEQAQGKTELDARTDVYSLGVVLYELATGQVPFAGESSYAIVHDHIYTPPPPPREINPEVSHAVERVLLKALAKNPDLRYDTPTAMMEDYRRAVSSESVQPRREAPAQVRISRPQRPQPPRPDDPFEELKAAGQEIKKAFQEAGAAWKSVNRKNRHIWHPGTKWTKDAYGNEGFFTEAELQEIEASIPDEVRIRQRVEKRLKERQGLYLHLTSYVIVISLLWFIWAMTMLGGHPWPLWPTLGWGGGLLAHVLTYYYEHGGGKDRREAAIQREFERERQRIYGDSYIDKAKNEYDDRPIRLTEDGELTDSFVDEWDEAKRKRR